MTNMVMTTDYGSGLSDNISGSGSGSESESESAYGRVKTSAIIADDDIGQNSNIQYATIYKQGIFTIGISCIILSSYVIHRCNAYSNTSLKSQKVPPIVRTIFIKFHFLLPTTRSSKEFDISGIFMFVSIVKL